MSIKIYFTLWHFDLLCQGENIQQQFPGWVRNKDKYGKNTHTHTHTLPVGQQVSWISSNGVTLEWRSTPFGRF